MIADRNIATATVTANCRNSSPEIPEMKATGTNTDEQHQRDRDDRARRSRAIASLVASPATARDAASIDLFDGLDHDDRVVHHDADRQDIASSDTVLAEYPMALSTMKVPIRLTGNGDRRNQGRAELPRNR